MERHFRAAVLIKLVEALRKEGSWSGETHIQKAAYILQALAAPELEWDFTLYKYGPFSFELRDEITMMRADYLLEHEIRSRRYGPGYRPGYAAQAILTRVGEQIKEYQKPIQFVTKFVRDRDVSELERLSTALYVTRKYPEFDADKRASEISNLKPHISLNSARMALDEIDKLRERAQNCGLVV